jgi:hypothetical protein
MREPRHGGRGRRVRAIGVEHHRDAKFGEEFPAHGGQHRLALRHVAAADENCRVFLVLESARENGAFDQTGGTSAIGFVDGVNGIALFCAIGFLFWRFTRVDVLLALRSEKIEAIEIRVFAATGLALLLWVVCNALLCGAFSGVYARYQARILWLIPMFALLAFFRLGHSANTHLVSALRTLN